MVAFKAMLRGDVWDVVCDVREKCLYDVPMFMSFFGLGIGMMFASFHV